MFFLLINHVLFFRFSVNIKKTILLKYNQVDGKPCKCELEEPCIMYMIETIISNILKLILGTISRVERDELRQFIQMPDAGRYIQIYIEELDKHRDIVGDVVLETI